LEDTAYTKKLPIPMASISITSEQTASILAEVDESLGLTPEQNERIDSIIMSMESTIERYNTQISEVFLKESSTILLDKTKTDIEQISDRIEGYRENIQAEIQKREGENSKIEILINIWEKTYNAERSTPLSNSVQQNLQELISKLKATDKKIDTYLNNLLEIELKLNNIHTDFNNLVNKIDDARDFASKNLWIPDSRPIWEIYTLRRDTVSIETKLRNAVKAQKNDAYEYTQFYKVNIILAIVALVSILVLFYFLRYRILKDEFEDPKHQENAILRLFSKPFFPGLLIGLYTSFILLPEKPFIIEDLIFLMALIPFTLVLMHILRGKKRYLVILLSFILALSVFSQIGFDIEVFSRTFMLIITILSLILLIVILRSKWDHLNDQPKMKSAFRVLAKTSLFILIVCLLGNIIGNYTLTSILLFGILTTVFSGISLYLVYLIVLGLIVAVFNSQWGQSYRIIKRYNTDIVNKVRRIVVFVLVIFFITDTFRNFKIFSSLYESIETFLITPFKLGNFSFTVNDILLFILILVITNWISRFVQFVLQEQVLFKSRKQKDLSASISSIVKFTIVTIGFFIAALASGFPLDKITLLISAFGVGIGFGLQSIFNNLVSGIILVFERPLQVGDTIEVGQLLGVVKSIGIRASTIRTFDGAEVIVPNGNLVSNELINWTLSDSQRRLIIKVGVAYGTDPNEVIKILMDVAKKKEGLLESPAPYVLFKEFGDSALGFELRCYTESDDWLFILSDLHVEVNDAIKEAGIVIPFPQRDLHIKTMDPNIVKTVKATPGNVKTVKPRTRSK
jgi:small-conductance mechanosensitive channel